jgi:hypothetical protein
MPSTTGNRHGPHRFDHYEKVHDSNMQMLAAEGFVLDDDLRFQPLGDQQIALTGVVRCQGQILVEVEKILEVQSGRGHTAFVQTTAYRYHAQVLGVGNILRYENSDHNQFDHVHRYDPIRGDRKGTFQRIEDKNAVPTLGDVLRELRDWYEANAESLGKQA